MEAKDKAARPSTKSMKAAKNLLYLMRKGLIALSPKE